MCFINYTEMARVTGVPFNYLLSRGQSIKVLSQLFRKANGDGYVVPALRGEGQSFMFFTIPRAHATEYDIGDVRYGRAVRRRHGH